MTAACPIPDAKRIDSIDVLRGVAVLGILALNIQSFAMPGCAYLNPTSFGDLTGINYWIWYLIYLFGDMKFWSIFSMLFGAGIIIMSDRCESDGRSAAKIHYRRMGWLLLIGLLHAHLIWFGDILYTYAMCGFVLYFFRKLPVWALFTSALVLLLVAFGISFAFGYLVESGQIPEMNKGLAEAWLPTGEQIQADLEIYRNSWLTQLPYRSKSALFMETFLFLVAFSWRSAGMILIGMGLYKMRVFNADRSRWFYLALLGIGLFVGIPIVAYGVYSNQQHNWSLEYSFYFGPMYNFWGSILVALGWVSLVMLVCQASAMKAFTRPFAAAGRMALTCYILQSVIATTIFNGHGLGQIGYFERWQQLLTVIGIWIFCLIFATVWLKRFRFGPLEWAWRSLTYWKLQPLK